MSDSAQTGNQVARRWQWVRRGGWLAICLFGCALLGAGCNPLSIGFLSMMMNPNIPPDWVDFTKKKPNPKVVFVVSNASADSQFDSDIINLDQLLSQSLNQVLTQLFAENGSKVDLVSPSRVQNYKASHPNDWKLDSEKIGKHFEADFVVCVEITKLSLYEARSNHQMYQGKAEIQVSLADLSDPSGGLDRRKSYICTFPETHPLPREECSMDSFRNRFIQRMSRDLSRWFVAYPFEQRHDFESGRFEM